MGPLRIAVSVLMLLTGASSAYAAPARGTVPAPHLSASELLALRGDTESEAVELEYRVQCEIYEKERVLETCNEIRTLVLGPDYAALKAPGRITILDRRLGRWFIVDTAQGAFWNSSLPAGLLFRAEEIEHRRAVRQGLLRLKNDPEKADTITIPRTHEPIWAEIELGSLWPNEAERSKIALARLERGAFLFSAVRGRKREPIARLQYSDKTLPDRFVGSYLAARAVFFGLHPHVIAAAGRSRYVLRIVDAHKLYTEQGHREAGAGERLARDAWEFRTMRRKKVSYPLRADHRNSGVTPALVFVGTDAPYWTVSPKLERTLFDAQRGAMPTKYGAAALTRAMETALAEGRPFDALLALHAGSGTHPDAFACTQSPPPAGEPAICGRAREALEGTRADPDGEGYIAALRAAQAGDFDRAAEAIATVDARGRPHGYVVDLKRGKILVDRLRRVANPAVSDVLDADRTMSAAVERALEANPYDTLAYAATASWLRGKNQHGVAWQFYELGLALPNGPKSAGLARFGQLEARVEPVISALFADGFGTAQD